MGRYTVLEDPRADAMVQAALDRVVELVTDLMGIYVDAIVLTGGCGRGEGGVVLEPGGYVPVSDLDLSVIVSRDYFRVKRKFSAPLERCAERLAEETGFKQIDIGISHPLRFHYAQNLVAFYELLNGHRVLWGTMNLKKIMPPLPAEHLSLLDGGIYFLSRGGGLLIPALYFVPHRKIATENQRNFQIEVDKACIAMGDAIFLLKKRYHFSYAERLRRFRSLDLDGVPEAQHVQSWYFEAVERKLRPRFQWPGDAIGVDRWFEVRDVFSRFFLWFEGIRLRRQFEDWWDYSIFVEHNVRDPWFARLRTTVNASILQGLGSLVRLGALRQLYRRSRSFQWATMPMILFSLKVGGVDAPLLERGRSLLGIPEGQGLEETWQRMAGAYLGIFHGGRVATRIIESSEVD